MIKNLFIQNYALIENLNIDFNTGFSVITGETGAGKSILIGALGLILGKRADINILKNKEIKCIAEATFDIKKYNLKNFFEENNLDYEEITNIRREIIPSGKSRAFINDTPVNLSQLQILAQQLIDIHSQHENLQLNNNSFQIKLIDAFAGNELLLGNYKNIFNLYKAKERELKILIEKEQKEKSDLEYIQFRFDELENAKLNTEEQLLAEEELEQLNHAEEIKKNISIVNSKLSDEETGIIKNLRISISALSSIEKYYKKENNLNNRLQSTKIELSDIASEIESSLENIEFNPQRLEFLNQRLSLIYSLQKKHNVNTISELLEIKNTLHEKLSEINNYESIISKTKKEYDELKQKLITTSTELSNRRKQSIPILEQRVEDLISQMGMPFGKFTVKFEQLDEFTENGHDNINLLFSANKNITAKEISKIASGGEVSRIMLAIKSIIAESVSLPTIIFDEIDTGISGEIADKTANIMLGMSKTMQLIDITHLPQVAAKADFHYLVYKQENINNTITNIKLLNNNERTSEIAAMLSGEKITKASIKNAQELLSAK